MEQLNEKKAERSRRNNVYLAFFLGIAAGAAAMFCVGFLYLRHNLILTYEFPDLTADDFDDAFENAMPADKGWSAKRESCALPMPTGGRAVYNWKFCQRNYARGLMDDPDHGLILPALLPCTISVADDPEDGHAVLSRLNTSLLGVIYGGNAREILRSHIAPEQEALIAVVASGIRKDKAQQKETAP